MKKVIAAHLVPGMVIHEKMEGSTRTRQIPVRKVVRFPEGCRHNIHVNDSMCFASGTPLQVEE